MNQSDYQCFTHYCQVACDLLTSNQGYNQNPYKSLIFPRAVNSVALAHALLGVGGAHLRRTDHNKALEERTYYHHDEALKALQNSVKEASDHNSDVPDDIILVLILQTCFLMIDGEVQGGYHVYIDANKYIKFRQDHVGRFAKEFVDYVKMGRTLTSLASLPAMKTSVDDGDVDEPIFDLDGAPSSFDKFGGILQRVLHGLLLHISKCVRLRRKIRKRKLAGHPHWIIYSDFEECQHIAWGIRQWRPEDVTEEAYAVIAEIFRRAVTAYLVRTLQVTTQALHDSVDQGLDLLESLREQHPANSILLLPIHILGCSAFEPRQRQRVEAAFEKLTRFSGFGNIEASQKVVRKVWEYMDANDRRSWDWEQIQRELGLDFSVS